MPDPQANPIPLRLHSTGRPARSNAPLPLGCPDPAWLVVLGPAGFAAADARVVAPPPGVATDDSAGFIWLPFGESGTTGAGGYTFRNLIDLSDFEADTVTISFEAAYFGVDPGSVEVNGRPVEPAGGRGQGRSYTIPDGRLRRGLNTLDIQALSTTGSGPAGVSIRYGPATGVFAPTLIRVDPGAVVTTGQITSATVRIESGEKATKAYQDLAVQFDPDVISDSSMILTQVITLDPTSGRVPTGPRETYDSNDPGGCITCRVIGLDVANCSVTVRAWLHAIPKVAATSGADPFEARTSSAGRAGPGRPGDPATWPSNSGVVVVVVNNGAGASTT